MFGRVLTLPVSLVFLEEQGAEGTVLTVVADVQKELLSGSRLRTGSL